MRWLVHAGRIAWRHKGPFVACGAALAVTNALLGMAWPASASILVWLLSGALGVLAYRTVLRRERSAPHTDAWATLPRAMMRGAFVQGLAAALVALAIGSLSVLALVAFSSSTGPVADPGAILSFKFIVASIAAIPVLLVLCIVGLPLALMLEAASALAVGQAATTTRSGAASFLLALRHMWQYRYRFTLPAYAIAAVAVLASAALTTVLPSGGWSEALLTTVGFA